MPSTYHGSVILNANQNEHRGWHKGDANYDGFHSSIPFARNNEALYITPYETSRYFDEFYLKCFIGLLVWKNNISVNYHEFTCGQKVVRCVSMA